MTIVAGFPGSGVQDGAVFHSDRPFVVLAADSEESGPVLKSSVRKIATIDKQTCKCLIAGAGGGDFIDLAIQEIEQGLTGPFTLNGVRQRVEKIVTDIHLKRIQRLKQPELGFVLLCAIWVSGEGLQLVRVGSEFSLILKSPDTIGSGAHLARYLIATYHVPSLNLYHATRLAVYLLSQAKKHVMYCGGNSQVVWIDGDGRVEELLPGSIAEHEKSNAAVMDVGARGLLFLVDPMGWGFDLSQVDRAVDEIGRWVKENIRASYPHLAATLPGGVVPKGGLLTTPAALPTPDAAPSTDPGTA